jgi:hypothetical protein
MLVIANLLATAGSLISGLNKINRSRVCQRQESKPREA